MDSIDASERDVNQLMWVGLQDDPLLVVLYGYEQQRQDLLEQVPLLLPPGTPIRVVHDPDEMFSDGSTVLLLTPFDELEALRVIEGRREGLLDRQRPAVLFLLRGGSAMKHLSSVESAGLLSWLRGRIIDVDRVDQIDAPRARARFTQLTGRVPEDWLKDWYHGALDDTEQNQALFHQASLISAPPEGSR